MEERNVTQTAISQVVTGADEIMQSHLSSLNAELLQRATPENQVSVEDINVLMAKYKTRSMFDGVHSPYLLDKYVTDAGGLTPEKCYLGRTRFWSATDPPVINQKVDYAYIVSVKQTLALLLNNPEVLGYVENPPAPADDGLYRDIKDGSWFKNHPLFSVEPRALTIYFYPDELQTSNPLGSKKHKFLMMYWSLGNIPPHLRSSLKAINLFGVVRAKLVKQYGLKKILSNFLDDILELESPEGMSFVINNEVKTFRGSLLFVTGDTPALQFFAGAKESVANANLPCRRCLGTKEFMQGHFTESEFVLRDKESHREHVRQVTDNTVPKAILRERSKQYGVTGESPMSVIETFDVTKCFVQDFMHVVFEGIMPLEVRLFLKFAIEEGLITLDQLNRAISSFNYGHLKKDKPSEIEPVHLENSLRQNSMQMSTLCHALPFIMKPFVESHQEGENRLMNLVKMIQITNVCLSFEVSLEDITVLEHLIKSHHTSFKVFYPDVNLPPKFHYLVHFPRQIMEFGPLRFSWCMRFEAAHYDFKRLMQIVLNYVNPPYSMVSRYCKKRSNQLIGNRTGRFLDLGDDVKRGKAVVVREHPHCDGLRLTLGALRNDDIVTNTRAVVVRGATFTAQSVLLLRHDPEELPIFAKVIMITVFGQDKVLIYKPVETLYFDRLLSACRIRMSDDFITGAVKVSDLQFLHPLSVWVCQNQEYVVLFHSRCEFLL